MGRFKGIKKEFIDVLKSLNPQQIDRERILEDIDEEEKKLKRIRVNKKRDSKASQEEKKNRRTDIRRRIDALNRELEYKPINIDIGKKSIVTKLNTQIIKGLNENFNPNYKAKGRPIEMPKLLAKVEAHNEEFINTSLDLFFEAYEAYGLTGKNRINKTTLNK